MQLGSILINAAEKITKVLLRDFEIVQDSGDRMGTAKMLVLYDPASDADIAPGKTVQIFRTDDTSEDGLWGGEIFGEPLFGASAANVPIFYGTITNIEREVMVARRIVTSGGAMWGEPQFGGPMFGEGTEYERVNLARIECRDWNSILENGVVPLGTAGFASKTDLFMISSLFGTVAPEVGLTNVASTATLATFDQVEGQSLRSILGRLSEMTGAVYYIDPEKKLHWFLPAARPSPWSVSESPDLTTSFPFDRNTFRYVQEWRTPANKVIVLGAVGTGGVRYSSTRTDATSIATYGTHQRTVSDRTITSNASAQARADVELANYANPQRSGRLSLRKAGLNVGQMLTIDATESLQLSGNFVIRRITMRWWNRSTVNYEIEWGSYLPDLARAIRTIYDLAHAGQPPGVQDTTPAPGSVGTGAYVAGSINNAAMGAASIGQANIQDGSIVTAHIQDAQITSAKIGTAEINNAHIASLSADKLNAGDVTVGGSGKPGSLIVRDGSGNPYGSIGGSTDGGWIKALAVGGSGVGTAKLKVSSSGDLTLSMTGSGDNFTLTVGGFTVTISSSGVYVSDGTHATTIDGSGVTVAISGSTAYHSQDTFSISAGGRSVAMAVAAGNPVVAVDGVVIIKERQTGWSAMTGTATKGGGDTSSVTLPQLAERVKALIDLLSAHHQLLG